MTLYAIRMAIRPPDLSYTYGYAKVESRASLTEIILLFVVAGWISYECLERIFFKTVQPEITADSFAIILYIAVDFGRSRSLYTAARKYGSQASEVMPCISKQICSPHPLLLLVLALAVVSLDI
jgi:divalent metal cation (Fe/Co/Zn/Cd) transporter